jgi:Na+/H+ antiporter NhaD/arsenite permease-like protein
LVRSWRGQESEGRSAAWPSFLSLPLAIAFLVLAAGLYLIVRRSEREKFHPADQVAPEGSWRSTVLVGFSEVENGRPLKGFALVVLLVVLLSLPLAEKLGYRIPWIYGPGGSGAALVAAVGLGIFVLLRLIGHARGSH